MAKKAKKKTKKGQLSTDWNVGQPLAFPSKKSASVITQLAQEAVQETRRGPFGLKRQKRKKK